MCPFCYIGKRKLEQALAAFEHTDDIEIDWKSFQLNPDMKTDPETSINEYLAESKGWSQEQARQMNRRVTDMGAEVGLEYNMDQIVVANSYDAHRLIQFAKTKDKGAEAEEALFRAYFTEGKNIADIETLIDIGEHIGLDTARVMEVLNSDQFANAVDHNIETAKGMNIQGVPFFLFDRKYAVSGAQKSKIFEKALRKSYQEWQEEQPTPLAMEDEKSATSSVEGSC